MAKIMMIGYGPLPQPGLKLFMAPSLRTRHLLHGVLEGGHDVELFTLPLPGTEGEEGKEWKLIDDEYEGLKFRRFSNHSGEFAIRTLNELMEEIQPDAIVGVNSYPSYVGAMLSSTVPLWCDLNGYWMAEMQARCAAEQDDSRQVGAWAIERAILRRCDKFSAVSRPQLHAVLGEMATVGRLNKFTFQYQFGSHLPNAAHRWDEPEDASTSPVFRGTTVPQNAFVVLWSGGFNLWTDIDTLLEAMNELMRRHAEVHFVSTGGQLDGVDSTTYERFQTGVEQSPYKERFHLLGWVDSELIPKIYREADVGLNVDGQNYETMFGARNRINAMAAEGLPIATTLGTEISEWLEDADAAITWGMGDPLSLVEALDGKIKSRDELKAIGERASAVMQEDFSYSKTTEKLRRWLEEPTLAPDNEAKVIEYAGELADLNATTVNPLEAQAVLIDQYDSRSLLQTVREIETLRNRRWYRLYRRLKRWLSS